MLAGQCLTPVGVSFVLLVAIASSDLPRFDKRCIPISELHSEAIFRCPELTLPFAHYDLDSILRNSDWIFIGPVGCHSQSICRSWLRRAFDLVLSLFDKKEPALKL